MTACDVIVLTSSSLPTISVTTTRSPTATRSPLVRRIHAAAPTIGTLKRTIPALSGCGATTIIPGSPIITLPPNPALVRSTDKGLINLNHATKKIAESTNQIMIWTETGIGINHKRAATIIAAAPNQRLANVGTNISTISSTKPNTSQCQGSIIQSISIIVIFPILANLAFNVAHFFIKQRLKSYTHKKTTTEVIVFYFTNYLKFKVCT